MSASKRKLIRRVSVDSGQIAILDPCNLSDLAYDECCRATYSKRAGTIENKHGATIAVIATNWCGDGSFPVFAEHNSDGGVIRLIIDFTGKKVKRSPVPADKVRS